MITIQLTAHALAAARAVDPAVTPAAVHAAIEVAVVEQLLEVADCSSKQIRARIASMKEDIGEFRLSSPSLARW